MGKYDVSFWIAQFLSCVAIGVFVFSWSQKLREQTLKFQVIGNILNISSYLFLVAYTGALMGFITLARNLIYRFKSKKKWIGSPYLMYFFMIVLVAGSLYTWKGPMTLLPCISCLLGTYSISLENTLQMKRYMLFACLTWIPYNIWVLAYMNAVGSIILSISIWIFLQKEKEILKKPIELL